MEEEKTYEEFIQNILDTRGRFNCGDEYHERHHIKPKCLGGGNEEENLIDLYAREHFIAHKLLVLENLDNDRLVYAYTCMAFLKNDYEHRYELTPDEYEEARKIHAGMISNRYTGEGNPFYGKIHTEETRQIIRESNTGRIRSEETCKKLSESLSGENNPRFGQHWDLEHKDAQSKRMRGENNPNYGKPRQDIVKEKISKSLKGKMPGENNPNYGKKLSEERKQKLRESHLGKHPSEETRKKQSDSHKGKVWTDEQMKKMSGENHFNYGTGKHVIQLSIDAEYIIEYISANEAYKITGINVSSILQCCNHKKWRKTAGGFKWMFKDEYEELNNINGGNNNE